MPTNSGKPIFCNTKGTLFCRSEMVKKSKVCCGRSHSFRRLARICVPNLRVWLPAVLVTLSKTSKIENGVIWLNELGPGSDPRSEKKPEKPTSGAGVLEFV